MKNIFIGKTEVPLVDYAVGASAVLGIRDSGKTVTSKGIAEQLIDHGIPIIVFDAVGKWRWMKVAGERHGGRAYKVVVAGGNAPDLPLTPHSVPEIVRAALKERIPLVIDLFSKNMSKADWRQIVQKAIHIIHYENEGGAVHVFLEEAAEFVPQKIYDGETYAEVEKLVRMGGNASVGITLINQRSQEVNKAVLDNCSTALVLGCQVGKNAIEAVEKWIERLEPKTAQAVTESLPKLQSGEAWVWTRKSLTEPSREKMPMCRSLHPDRRTPEIVLKQAKPADTAEFVARMSNSIPKVIEEAKANDPTELNRTIAKLKQENAALQKQKPVEQRPASAIKVKEVPALTPSERKRITSLTNTLEKMCKLAEQWANDAKKLEQLVHVRRHFEPDFQILKAALEGKFSAPPIPARTLHTPVKSVRESDQIGPVPEHNGTVSGGIRRMMTALAQRPGLNRRQLGVRAGLSSKSGTFGTYLGKLRSNQWIDGSGDSMFLTQLGRVALGRYDPLPEGEKLLQYWLSELGDSGAGRMLRVLADAYPSALTKGQIGEAANISSGSGTFGTYLGRLRSLELITGRGEIKASDEFFQ